jgi:hypothetical protein
VGDVAQQSSGLAGACRGRPAGRGPVYDPLVSSTPSPEPDAGPVASPGDLVWRTDHLLGEPFEEADLGPATLVRYRPGKVVPGGERPASGTDDVSTPTRGTP